jgi:tetratricopeptide (TPR) repeat protein
MPEFPYVFISYASADRERVLPVVDRLEQAGVSVWIDREGIHGGANYALEIAEAIEGATAVMLMCSPASLASRNVKQEIALAWRFERPYLPLLLDPVEIPKDVAYWLEASQWIELLDHPESEWLAALGKALDPLGIRLQPTTQPQPLIATRERPLLVGREREQMLLRGQLTSMLAGHGSLVLIGGEAGIGKTTLVDDLTIEAEEQGCPVLWGHAYDLSVTPPYGPWLEIFRQYRTVAGSVLPPAPSFVFDAEELSRVGSQETLFAAVADFLRSVATHRPLMLVLDDLHWFDQESLDFVRFLARQVANQRILLVATYRSDELHRRHPLYDLLPLLVREASAERLDVGRLAATGYHALIARRYALDDHDQERLAAYLASHAEGNPLYAGELLRTLEHDEVVQQHGDDWHVGDLTTVRVPPLLRQVIEGRLAVLNADTRALLQVGAVIGQEVPLDLWQQATGAGDDALIAALEQGREARLVDDGPGGDAWHFHHALIREALYADLISLRRRGIHRQVGEQLLRTASPDPDMVAHHFQQASDPRAVEWLRNAGQRAERAYAWLTAIERYEAVLSKLTEQGGPTSERAVLLYHIARLHRFLDQPKTVELMGEARQLALDAGEPVLAARCQYVAGMVRFWLGDVAESIAAMEQADADYEALPKPDQVRLWSMLGIDADAFAGTLVGCLATIGRFDDAVSLGTRQITDVPFPSMRVGQGESQYADGLIGLANVAAFRGHPHEAQHNLEQARAIYQTIEHHYILSAACQFELEWVQLPYFTDDLEGRRRLVALGEEAARRSGSATLRLPLRWHAVGDLALAGDWHVAWEIATDQLGNPSWLIYSYGARWLVPLAVWRGDTDLAWRTIGRSLPAGPRTDPGTVYFPAALPLQPLAAALALDAHDLPNARAWLEAYDRWLAWSGAVLGRAEGALGWAAYHHANRDSASARAAAQQALAHASDPRQPLALIAVHRFLGQLDTEAGQFEAADEHLETSLKLAEACQAPFERALTVLEIAKLRIAEGKMTEASTLLAEVRAICEPLEAKPTLERVAEIERTLDSAEQEPRHV